MTSETASENRALPPADPTEQRSGGMTLHFSHMPTLALALIAILMVAMFGYSRHLGYTISEQLDESVQRVRHSHGELSKSVSAMSLGQFQPGVFIDTPLRMLVEDLRFIRGVIEDRPAAPSELAPNINELIAEAEGLQRRLRTTGDELQRFSDSVRLLAQYNGRAYEITNGLADSFDSLALDLFVSDMRMVQSDMDIAARNRARSRYAKLSRQLRQSGVDQHPLTERVLEASWKVIEGWQTFSFLMNDLAQLTAHRRFDLIQENLNVWHREVANDRRRMTDVALILGLSVLGAAAYYMRRLSHIAGRLRDANDQLENRVGERTAELSSSNMSLRREIADRREAERRLSRMAMTDTLTGLGNRSLIRHRLEVEISEVRGKSLLLGLFLVDLDHFKTINEGYGHDTGDELLRETGQRLGCLFDGQDTIVRLGDDEFAILVTCLKDVEHVNQTAKRILDAVAEPSAGTLGQIGLRASVGVSIAPIHEREPDALLRMAGVALDAAKQGGRGDFQIYQPDMDINSRDRRALEDELSKAIGGNELTLFYQPQIDIKTGRLCGAEALVRWEHPERGMVSPGEFIPIAEANGSILEIGRWALWTAAEQRLAWEAEGLGDFRIAVNISPRQVQSPGFVETVSTVLETTGLNPRLMELEVTENLLISNSDGVPDVLHELYCLGVELAIDDFGTGYSSLNYLKRFSVHRLKIDRSFIADARDEPEDRAIVRTVIRLGQTLGLRVLAEGVEDRETLDFLAAEGCDEVQGYFYAKPMPAETFSTWVRNFEGSASEDRSVA
ncbi:MAG: EAL domain-containing protein [Pseudomonadota bacterium]